MRRVAPKTSSLGAAGPDRLDLEARRRRRDRGNRARGERRRRGGETAEPRIGERGAGRDLEGAGDGEQLRSARGTLRPGRTSGTLPSAVVVVTVGEEDDAVRGEGGRGGDGGEEESAGREATGRGRRGRHREAAACAKGGYHGRPSAPPLPLG